MPDRKPRRTAGLRRFRGLRHFQGPWRIAVAEASMRPAIEPGDWLLVDPTLTRWPRRGSVVVFREPDGGELAVKRVAAVPGERVPFVDGYLELAEDEAWLVSDATVEETAAAGFGEPIDSRRYGPVQLDLLVGRAWFRYAPIRRIGRIARVTVPGAPVMAAPVPGMAPTGPAPTGPASSSPASFSSGGAIQRGSNQSGATDELGS